MYLHLGQNAVVPHKAIIGIFDLDITSRSPKTRDFLARAQTAGQVETATGGLPASFTLCQRDGKTTVYLSQLSAAALARRARNYALDGETEAAL